MEADMTVSCSCPKLIVRGARAEQPRPARPNAGTPNPGAPRGSAAMSANAPAATKGRARYVHVVGNHRWTRAKRTRPAVTVAQNAVSASDASVAEAPRCVLMYVSDQLPFIVSQTP